MKHIIIIDDSPTICASVEMAVQSLGLPIAIANDGMEALDKIKEIRDRNEDIAICIADINMPNMDGITFIKEFRKFDSHTPILVLTTEGQKEKILEGREAGASGWAIKPFNAKAFLDAVKKLIRI